MTDEQIIDDPPFVVHYWQYGFLKTQAVRTVREAIAFWENSESGDYSPREITYDGRVVFHNESLERRAEIEIIIRRNLYPQENSSEAGRKNSSAEI